MQEYTRARTPLLPPSYKAPLHFQQISSGLLKKNHIIFTDKVLLEIHAAFRPTPHALAKRYIKAAGDRGVLTEFERDRIVYEGTLDTYQLLLSGLGSVDELITDLRNMLGISARVDNVML